MIKNNNNNKKINILVPNLPESVIDATVAVWHKKVGDNIKCDEILLEIETDKIMLDISAPNDGVLSSILQQEGSIVTSGQILGQIYINYNKDIKEKQEIQKNQFERKNDNLKSYDVEKNKNDNDSISPVVRQLLSEHNLNLEVKNILGSGIKGRLTRQDIDTHLNKKIQKDYQIKSGDQEKIIEDKIANDNKFFSKKEKRVLMSRLRKRVAERLLDVKNNTAMLTTFNEVNMNSIIILRETYGKIFEKVHNVKLGFMSFFVKATLQGLKKFPEINASIDGEEIVYHNYFDISIAVSTDRGLITPVLKDVDKLEIFDIEKNLKLLAEKARNKKLTLQELNGGNFTITNGGIFGSLMSTPIINPPQSAILGMHAIKNRPIVFKNEIKIFPMMYLALSYDHRLIDGKDAVGFLVLIKELLEDPIRLLLHI